MVANALLMRVSSLFSRARSSRRTRSSAALAALLALATVLVTLGACSESLKDIAGSHGDLIAGKRAWRKTGISQTERLTDALIAIDGDNWQTDVTTAFKGNAEAIWDLGKTETISCLFLQGDNNDTYFVDGSEDASNWTNIWSALPVKTPGMQSRKETGLNARARYIRLHATGGDGLFSASELAIYSSCDPATFPAHFEQRTGVIEDATSGTPWRLAIVVVSLLLIGFRPKKAEAQAAREAAARGSRDMIVPVGVIVMLSGVLMETVEMALAGLAILAWPSVKAFFEPNENEKTKKPAGKDTEGKAKPPKASAKAAAKVEAEGKAARSEDDAAPDGDTTAEPGAKKPS